MSSLFDVFWQTFLHRHMSSLCLLQYSNNLLMFSATLNVKSHSAEGVLRAPTIFLDELEQDVEIVTSCDPNAFICRSSERVNALVKKIFSTGLN